jgi:hypothetical protein
VVRKTEVVLAGWLTALTLALALLAWATTLGWKLGPQCSDWEVVYYWGKEYFADGHVEEHLTPMDVCIEPVVKTPLATRRP